MLNSVPDKEGWLRKRGARMHRWTSRYFILSGASLHYKLKPEATSIRGTFDLIPGCILTEVVEDVKGAKKGKKLFSFWLVWPEDETKCEKVENDSDGEEDAKDDGTGVALSPQPKTKDLKQIVESEVMTHKRQQRIAEETLEKHHANDNSISLGVKIAGVVVGGVVVGALTAGIGLVPYVTAVGITALASGGAVAYHYRRPSDSRLILGCETMWEALAWRAAIEEQISNLEASRKPNLPATVNPLVISHILGNSYANYSTSSLNWTSAGASNALNHATWRKVGLVEGVRIMELRGSSENVCRKAQMVLSASPVNAFLAVMDAAAPCWPKDGSMKTLQTLDDHVDIMGVRIPLTPHQFQPSYKRKNKNNLPTELAGCLTRFWKLDDDGSYLITYNTASDYLDESSKQFLGSAIPLYMDAVLTISPRRDFEDFEDDLPQCLITCHVQLSSNALSALTDKALNDFMTSYVSQIVDLRYDMMMSKYDVESIGLQTSSAPAQVAVPVPLTPVANKSVRGNLQVTTVQPGMELSRSFSAPSGLVAPPKVQRSLSPLQMQALSSTSTDTTARGAKSPRKGDAILPPPTKNRNSRRTQRINAEASALRSQIASKEFEASRLEKMMRKKHRSDSLTDEQKQSSGPTLGRSDSTSPTAGLQATPLQQQSMDLALELKHLKSRYFQLTGVPYEQSGSSRRRMLFSRRKHETKDIKMKEPSREMDNSIKKSQLEVSTKSSSESAVIIEDKEDPASLRKLMLHPPHWSNLKVEHTLRMKNRHYLTADAKASIVVITVFSLCMCASMFLMDLYQNVFNFGME